MASEKIYCLVHPPPKTGLDLETKGALLMEEALIDGSLLVVSPDLHIRHENQVNALRVLDKDRHYWWGMLYARPAPPPATLLKWSSQCKANLKGTGRPVVELYPPFLLSLEDLLLQSRLDLRVFVWLENVFDGLKVMSDGDFCLCHLTPSMILLVAKDKFHPKPRFVLDVSSLDAVRTAQNNPNLLSPPETSRLGEVAYLDRFNALTPTSISPRKRIIKTSDGSSPKAYATFLLGMVFMDILRTSPLRYVNRDFYEDLSLLANDMTAFNVLRRPTLEAAKERYLNLCASHAILEGLDMDKDLPTRPHQSKKKFKKTKKRRNKK